MGKEGMIMQGARGPLALTSAREKVRKDINHFRFGSTALNMFSEDTLYKSWIGDGNSSR